ncbi:tRNA isopentenyl-2-thiomethyl-A-37 hydroxylase MiaE, partial [Cronobacter sakazakii]|uniref:tRNA isopentenyl-2-thiomethyl-A-37 hydroxylase MiaE n=1 Tax=Cronobacter sakazakii TaxID=28141 RepID=UPI000D51D0A3
MNYDPLLPPVKNFLHCATPQAWLDEARAPENLPLLLTDHKICELNAAQPATPLNRR